MPLNSKLSQKDVPAKVICPSHNNDPVIWVALGLFTVPFDASHERTSYLVTCEDIGN